MNKPRVDLSNPCWARIGVWRRGEERCPELDRVVHCRNCEVFLEAGELFFERPAEPIESLPRAEADAAAGVAFLVFRVRGERFALPLRSIDEVVPPASVQGLPHARDRNLLGMVLWRGRLVPCVSLEGVLGFRGPREAKDAAMLVLPAGDGPIAVHVEEIVGVFRFSESDLAAPPATLAWSASMLTRGLVNVGEHRCARLDEGALAAALSRSLA